MRRIVAFSVLFCLAASPAFANGTGSSGGTGAGAGASPGTGTGVTGGDHGEADARGFSGNGLVGQAQDMRWDGELRCPFNTVSCR